MRKGHGYDYRPKLSLSLETCEPFLAMFNTRQEECFESQRRGVSASRAPALFLLLCVSCCPAPTGADVLLQVSGGTQRCSANKVQGYAGGEEGQCGKRFWSWTNFIRKWEWANLLFQTTSPYSLSVCQHWWWGYHSSGKPVKLFFH